MALGSVLASVTLLFGVQRRSAAAAV